MVYPFLNENYRDYQDREMRGSLRGNRLKVMLDERQKSKYMTKAKSLVLEMV